VWISDQKIWWEAANSVRIPTAILVATILGLRIYSIYRSAKNTSRRSPRVRRIERIVAISLWGFIALGATFLLLAHR